MSHGQPATSETYTSCANSKVTSSRLDQETCAKKIVLAPLAAQDLSEASEYIALDNPDAADQLLVKITNALALLASGIVSGADVTLRDGQIVRYWPVPPSACLTARL